MHYSIEPTHNSFREWGYRNSVYNSRARSYISNTLVCMHDADCSHCDPSLGVGTKRHHCCYVLCNVLAEPNTTELQISIW